ncbi:hypothetical protein BH10ACT1_BH10ACT1_22140 [soil metagenome]
MPTYEYRCKTCEHQFDIVQSFTDDSLTVCPECGGPLKKVFGNVGITFKGSGFYKTDSRSAGTFGSAKDADRTDAKKSAEAASSSSDSSSSTSSSSDAKSEKKTEKKAEKKSEGSSSSSGGSSSSSTSSTSKS